MVSNGYCKLKFNPLSLYINQPYKSFPFNSKRIITSFPSLNIICVSFCPIIAFVVHLPNNVKYLSKTQYPITANGKDVISTKFISFVLSTKNEFVTNNLHLLFPFSCVATKDVVSVSTLKRIFKFSKAKDNPSLLLLNNKSESSCLIPFITYVSVVNAIINVF